VGFGAHANWHTRTAAPPADVPAPPHRPQCPLPPRDQWDDALEARMVLLQARGLLPQFFLTAEGLEKAGGWSVPQDVRDVLEVGRPPCWLDGWMGTGAGMGGWNCGLLKVLWLLGS
jgi:hypothetical protein